MLFAEPLVSVVQSYISTQSLDKSIFNSLFLLSGLQESRIAFAIELRASVQIAAHPSFAPSRWSHWERGGGYPTTASQIGPRA